MTRNKRDLSKLARPFGLSCCGDSIVEEDILNQYTVKEYCQTNHIVYNTALLSKYGKAATKLSKDEGYEVGHKTIKGLPYNKTNTYDIEVLKHVVSI